MDKSTDCITLEFVISWDFELTFIHHINFFMMRRQHCSGSSLTQSRSKSSTIQLWNPIPGMLPPAPLSSKGQKYNNPRGLLGDYRLPNYKIHDEKTALQWEFPHSPQIKIKHFTTMEPNSWYAASSPSEFQGTKYDNPRGLLGATF
jgi:hypothetical protein